jgi:hypothetical protein
MSFAFTGTGPNENPGNQFFRETLKMRCDEYRSAASRRLKKQTILSAISDFQKQGGRFLQRVFLTNETKQDQASTSSTCTFEVVEGTPVFLKARQAFRYLLRESEGPEKSIRDSSQGMDTQMSSGGSKASSEAAHRHDSATRVTSTEGDFLDQFTSNDTARSMAPAGFQVRGPMTGLASPYYDISTRILAEAARRDLQAASSGLSSFPRMLPGISVSIPFRTSLFGSFLLGEPHYSDGLGGLLVSDMSVHDHVIYEASYTEVMFLTHPTSATAKHDTTKRIRGNDLTDCE